MYKTSTYGHEQGPGCGFRHAARARHPCRRRQLRLRHHQARGRVIRRAPAVDRRHALSRAAPARAPRSCRGEVVRVRERPQAQVLPNHERRPGAARSPAAAVEGGGRYPAGYLDAGVHSMTTFAERTLEEQITQWREYLRRRQALHGPDVEELEGHLRDQLVALTEAGLAGDEAFLVAVKRMGSLDALSREFARAHSERLWKQLVMAPDAGESAKTSYTETLVVLGLAVAAALAVKVPALFGHPLSPHEELPPFYFRNASLFVLPLLTIYFLWKRGLRVATGLWLALAFAAAAVFANIYPFRTGSDTQRLSALHLPIALWLAVGFAYVRGRWFADDRRMNFVRFSGELAIYYVLIALGGGVVTGFTVMMFSAIDMNPEWFIGGWLIPCGAAGAVIIASWLVEAKQGV